MSLVLDSQTEQRFQQELSRRNCVEPAELINRALDALGAEEAWTPEDTARFDGFLDERMAQFERGEGISGDKVRELLAQKYPSRTA